MLPRRSQPRRARLPAYHDHGHAWFRDPGSEFIMAALDQTTANNVIDALLGTAAFVATVTPLTVRYGTSAPNATTNMTQLSGTGYTTGGYTVTWNAASIGGQTATNITVLSSTNGSGGAWTIVGI